MAPQPHCRGGDSTFLLGSASAVGRIPWDAGDGAVLHFTPVHRALLYAELSCKQSSPAFQSCMRNCPALQSCISVLYIELSCTQSCPALQSCTKSSPAFQACTSVCTQSSPTFQEPWAQPEPYSEGMLSSGQQQQPRGSSDKFLHRGQGVIAAAAQLLSQLLPEDRLDSQSRLGESGNPAAYSQFPVPLLWWEFYM